MAGRDEKPRGLEWKWRWDKAKRRYVGTQRSIPSAETREEVMREREVRRRSAR